jgi:hypothetical protein
MLRIAAAAGVLGFVAAEQARPITKVVNLLEKMAKESAAEGKKERVMFAKFKCWCDTNTEDKTAAIAKAEDEIATLSSEIEELQGASGKLSMEVAQLQADMEANVEARDKAQSLRDKANEKFLAAEADMEAAIASMGEAISTLAAVGADQTDDATRDRADHEHAMGAAFMAKKSSVQLKKIGASINEALVAASAMLSKQDQQKVADELSFIQAKAAPGVYSSQSGEIIGILKNMRDTFTENLADARSAEAKAVEAHDKFMATKKEEHELMDASYTSKQGQLGENDETLGSKKDLRKSTAAQLAEDQSFLTDLTAMCAEKTAQYEERKSVRAGEEAAIAQAISVLSSDDAFSTFGSVSATSGKEEGPLGKSFVQLSSKAMTPRQSVMKMLLLASKNTKSLKLAKIAVALQAGNPFATVLKTIDNMIALIDKEEQADDDKKAWCDEERSVNKATKTEKEEEMSRLEGVIADLAADIETYNGEKDDANTSLTDNKKSQAEKTADRAEELEFYQMDIKNLTEAQKLLRSALATLQNYYKFLHAKQGDHTYTEAPGTNSKGSLIKRVPGASVDELKEACSGMAECVGFDDQGNLKSEIGEEYSAEGSTLYTKTMAGESAALALNQQPVYEGDDQFSTKLESQGAKSGVVGMIEQIVADTEKEEEEAHTAEAESLKLYEETMTDLQEEQKTLEETIASLEKNIAEAEVSKSNAKADLKKTTADHAAVVAYLAQIKPGCDFIDENLQHRKDARTAEKSALENAVTLLKGTPAFKSAVHAADQKALGECKDTCNDYGREHAECEACLAGTSVPGYCAGHAGTPGC